MQSPAYDTVTLTSMVAAAELRMALKDRGLRMTPQRQLILDAVNRSGRAYLTHTRLDGRLTIRVAIGNPHTALADIRELWDLMLASAAPAAR